MASHRRLDHSYCESSESGNDPDGCVRYGKLDEGCCPHSPPQAPADATGRGSGHGRSASSDQPARCPAGNGRILRSNGWRSVSQAVVRWESRRGKPHIGQGVSLQGCGSVVVVVWRMEAERWWDGVGVCSGFW